MAAWRLVTHLCDETLSKYPTTIAEDDEILLKDERENHLSNNHRNCIIYRITEKAVLLYLKDIC